MDYLLLHCVKTNYFLLDERPDLSTAEIKLKSQVQMKSKKKSRLKSRNAADKITDELTSEKKKSHSSMDELTNIVITTAAQYVSSIRYGYYYFSSLKYF